MPNIKKKILCRTKYKTRTKKIEIFKTSKHLLYHMHLVGVDPSSNPNYLKGQLLYAEITAKILPPDQPLTIFLSGLKLILIPLLVSLTL